MPNQPLEQELSISRDENCQITDNIGKLSCDRVPKLAEGSARHRNGKVHTACYFETPVDRVRLTLTRF
jgi:hypothetical protein